jgi:hypothetical protein
MIAVASSIREITIVIYAIRTMKMKMIDSHFNRKMKNPSKFLAWKKIFLLTTI